VLDNTYYIKIKITDATGQVVRITRQFTPLNCPSHLSSTPSKNIPVLELDFYDDKPIQLSSPPVENSQPQSIPD